MPPAAPGKSLGTLNNPATVQIQFAYDSLRRQINRMLGDLARAWCLEQKRQNMVLRELTKINPPVWWRSPHPASDASERRRGCSRGPRMGLGAMDCWGVRKSEW